MADSKDKAIRKRLHVKNESVGTHKSYVSEVSRKKDGSGYTKHLKLSPKLHLQ